MNNNEKLLVEAMQSFLSSKAKLGLDTDKTATNDNNPEFRGFEYLHGQIDEMFAHKAADLIHHTGICSSFSKVHSYKYLDDDTFSEAMDKEMTAQGIPAQERSKALQFIPAIIKELKTEAAEWAEKDFGFHDDLDEIIKISQPQQYED